MGSTPECRVVLKHTFLHVEMWCPEAGKEHRRPGGPLRRRHRTTSQPGLRGGSGDYACSTVTNQVASSPLFINDGSRRGWKKVSWERAPLALGGASSGESPVASTLSLGDVLSDSAVGSPTPLCHSFSAATLATEEEGPGSATAWDDAESTEPPSPPESVRVRHSDGPGDSTVRASTWSLPGKRSADGGHMWTTMMMRNIPNSYTRRHVCQLIDFEGFAARYDFLYYPVDFKTSAGLGFAFVNLTSPEDAHEFRDHFTCFRRWGVPSGKVCSVSWARAEQQGLEANVEHYRNSSVMHKSVKEDRKPILLVAGVPTNLPKNTKKLWPPHSNFGRRARRSLS